VGQPKLPLASKKRRAILVRYDKKPVDYLGLIQPACSLLWYCGLRRLTDAQIPERFEVRLFQSTKH
jgi:hypothetical protein